MNEFEGFSPELIRFLKDLKNNNNREWFQANREHYQKYLVKPAKAYVTAIAPFFNNLNPQIRTAPKFNHTLMRLNNDMRFHKGAPYRTYFLIHFGKFKLDSEFYVYFDDESVQIGLFINNSGKENHYFKENSLQYKKELFDVFAKYKVNNNFSFYRLEKSPQLVKSKFTIEKNFDLLVNEKMILLQKTKPPAKSKIDSPQFLIESMKIFQRLYPVYCFAVSPFPLKILKHFEDYSWDILG